ncbi:hypothetical protein BGZ74_004484, partial [Mortierella antarctica]
MHTGPAFDAIEGKALYLQGGQLTHDFNFGIISQTFSIDLSKPWDVVAPLYSKMPDGIPGFQHPSAVMNDNLSWLILVNRTMYTYNLATGAIANQVPMPEAISDQGFSAVINPFSNSFFVPYRYNNSGTQSSLEYSSTAPQRPLRSPHFPPLAGFRFYALARSNYAKAAFVFGGNRWDPPGGGSITDIARDSPCMASVYNGAMMILFGGTQSNTLSDIYMYDVASNTWTPGQPGVDRRVRASSACTVSGDFFIVYGGYTNKNDRNPPSELTSVYNLKTNKWVARYELPAESTGLSAGAIAGSVVGGVAVIAGVVLFVLYRRKKRNTKKDTDLQQLDPVLKESWAVTPKEETFPLVAQPTSTNVNPYATHEHQSQLNVPLVGRSVQEWPSGSELRGPQS